MSETRPTDINPGVDLSDPKPILVSYINWRGEKSRRRILPNRIVYGATEYHPRHQWLMEAMDLDKSAMRLFALEDMNVLGPANLTPEPSP